MSRAYPHLLGRLLRGLAVVLLAMAMAVLTRKLLLDALATRIVWVGPS